MRITAFAVFYLTLFVAPALLTASQARKKGRSYWGYLVASLVFFWVVPFILISILPAKKSLQRRDVKFSLAPPPPQAMGGPPATAVAASLSSRNAAANNAFAQRDE